MSKCCELVADGGMRPRFHQCTREGKVERDGKPYCTIHDPILIKRRADERSKKWREERDQKRRLDRLANAALEMYEAMSAVLTRGCDCYDVRDEAYHSDKCPIPLVRAALAKADSIA